MSQWLKMVSDLKRRSPKSSYFTENQRTVFEQICDWLSIPERVNLYGDFGTGKTFVAWGLAEELDYVEHLSNASEFDTFDNSPTAILIDNAPHSEYRVRKIMARSNLLTIESIVFITRRPVAMQMRKIELPLPSEKEIREIENTLARLGFSATKYNPEKVNLWNVLSAHI